MCKSIRVPFLMLILLRFGHLFLISREVSEKEETFVKNQNEYTFLDVSANWEEAKIICESNINGALATVENAEVRTFLGLALSETNLEPQEYWIGAQLAENTTDQFKWIHLDNTLNTSDKYFIKRGKEHVILDRRCLALSRQYHDTVLFIDLECNLHRAVICEKSIGSIQPGSLTIQNWVLLNGTEYGIFYDKKTWEEAMRECSRLHNGQLASFSTFYQIETIGRLLLIGRPSLEKAWIGGQNKNGVWYFVPDNILISEETNVDTQFPPWRFNRTVLLQGCLLLDRHLSKTPVFIEARCTQRRSYICEKKKKNIVKQRVTIINKTAYIFYYSKRNWFEAFETCKWIDASLIKVSFDVLHDITYMMGENQTEVNHIWIGGRLADNGSYFYWTEDGEKIPAHNSNINHFPPWYSIEFDLNYSCLNLDRENHNRPMFYGTICEYPQEFICVQRNLSKLSELHISII